MVVQSGCLILVLFFLIQCKTNQRSAETGKIPDGKYIKFHNKINRATIYVYQDSSNCLKDSLLQSFRNSLPTLALKNFNIVLKEFHVKRIYVKIKPLITDSTACDGLYIYSVHTESVLSSSRYSNGTPYSLYAVKGNDVLFFSKDTEENKKKLASLKGMPLYQKMMKYEQNILRNLIIIK